MVASISSTNHHHLQRIENYCFNSVLCVPFNETIIKARKLSDQEIHKLAQIEGMDDFLIFNLFLPCVVTGVQSLTKRRMNSVDHKK